MSYNLSTKYCTLAPTKQILAKVKPAFQEEIQKKKGKRLKSPSTVHTCMPD